MRIGCGLGADQVRVRIQNGYGCGYTKKKKGYGGEHMRRKVGMGTDADNKSGAGMETGAEIESDTGAKVRKKPGRKPGTGTKKSGTGAKKRKKYTVSEAALTQRRTNNNLIPAETPEQFDYNTRLINHIIRIQEIASHADRRDPVSLRAAFISYLQLCQQDGFSVSNLAAYASMGVTYKEVTKWLTGVKPEYRELAQFVRTVCGLSREQQISDSKINPVIGIFWQRNFDGLRNDTEQTQSVDGSEMDSDSTTAGEYMQRYGKLLDE